MLSAIFNYNYYKIRKSWSRGKQIDLHHKNKTLIWFFKTDSNTRNLNQKKTCGYDFGHIFIYLNFILGKKHSPEREDNDCTQRTNDQLTAHYIYH